MEKELNKIIQEIKKSLNPKHIIGFDDYNYAFDKLLKSLNINKCEIFEINEKNLFAPLNQNIKAIIINYESNDFNQAIPEKIKQAWRLSMEHNLKIIEIALDNFDKNIGDIKVGNIGHIAIFKINNFGIITTNYNEIYQKLL